MKHYMIPTTDVVEILSKKEVLIGVNQTSYQEAGYAPERILEGGSKVGQALYI